MKKTNFAIKLFSLFALSALVLTISCSKEDEVFTNENVAQQEPSVDGFTAEPIEGQYIVTFMDGFETKSASLKDISYTKKIEMIREELSVTFKKSGISNDAILDVYGYTVNGFAAKLNDEQLNILRSDSRVKRVEQDYMITLSPISAYKRPAPEPVVEETPWGIIRVGGGITYTGNATAWIIDSGIDLDHPDLNVDVSRSVCFLDRGDADDENGHGTHVAGTVAAIDNEIGVIGVAPGATLVSVRVLDRRGSGSISGVIAGVDYVGANGSAGDVANMSLGGGISTTLDDAVLAASTEVKFSLAAGNESDDANNHSPARVNGPNIYTISAMDSSDVFAYFSNYGNPPIDYCAPGVSISSTWKDGGYNTISGTSMAAPHVCGLLLLGNITTDGYVQGDPDGNPDPIAHN